MCIAVYAPVCGDDGVTYSSGCRFTAAACRNPELGQYKEGACSDAGSVGPVLAAVFMVAAVVAWVVCQRFRRATGTEMGDDVQMSGDGGVILSEGDSPGSLQKDGKTSSSDRSISEEKLDKHSSTETISTSKGEIETILTPKGAGHPLDATTPSVPSSPFSLSTSEPEDVVTPELDQHVSSPPCALLPRILSPAISRVFSPAKPAGGF